MSDISEGSNHAPDARHTAPNHVAVRLAAEKVKSADGRVFKGRGGAYNLARHLLTLGAEPDDSLVFVWSDGRSSVTTTVGDYANAMPLPPDHDPFVTRWRPHPKAVLHPRLVRWLEEISSPRNQRND